MEREILSRSDEKEPEIRGYGGWEEVPLSWGGPVRNPNMQSKYLSKFQEEKVFSFMISAVSHFHFGLIVEKESIIIINDDD